MMIPIRGYGKTVLRRISVYLLSPPLETQTLFCKQPPSVSLKQWLGLGGYACVANDTAGCCIAGFPNFFTILGPNTITGHYSTIYAAECSINYALRMARAVLSSHATSVEVLPRAQREYSAWLQRELEKCIWTRENGGTPAIRNCPRLVDM